MSDTTFESLVFRVNPLVTGCPYPTIVQALQDSARRTFERTLAWRVQLPLFNLDPGVHEYFFNAPADTQVHAVLKTFVNDCALEALSLDRAFELYPKWADFYSNVSTSTLWGSTNTSGYNVNEYNEVEFNNSPAITLPDAALDNTGQPRSICQLDPQKYVILPAPDDARTYAVRMFAALKPKRDATSVPTHFMEELEDAIVHGALQYLYIIKDSPWFDTGLATFHARQYSYMTAERRARANLSAARSNFRAKAQPFS
tara:strand:- start:385 stop:1155 length:771 start_codon:yes stop_codon:yes gene_type:complete